MISVMVPLARPVSFTRSVRATGSARRIAFKTLRRFASWSLILIFLVPFCHRRTSLEIAPGTAAAVRRPAHAPLIRSRHGPGVFLTPREYSGAAVVTLRSVTPCRRALNELAPRRGCTPPKVPLLPTKRSVTPWRLIESPEGVPWGKNANVSKSEAGRSDRRPAVRRCGVLCIARPRRPGHSAAGHDHRRRRLCKARRAQARPGRDRQRQDPAGQSAGRGRTAYGYGRHAGRGSARRRPASLLPGGRPHPPGAGFRYPLRGLDAERGLGRAFQRRQQRGVRRLDRLYWPQHGG